MPTLGQVTPNTALRAARMVAGLSQGQLAALVNTEIGRATKRNGALDGNTVSRLERGAIVRPAQWTVDALCRVLGRPESDLGFQRTTVAPHRGPSTADAGLSGGYQWESIDELRETLADYSSLIPGGFAVGGNDKPRCLADLRHDLNATFHAYQQSRFSAATIRASALIRDVHAAVLVPTNEHSELLEILALSYQAASSVLTKVGNPSLAWLAADRGLNAAKDSGNMVVFGSLIRSVSFSLYCDGRLESAMKLIESGAQSLESQIGRKEPSLLSVYGTLFLAGSMAAARFGDGDRARDYLREANDIAHRLDRDANYFWTAFGPTNVEIHRVSTASELGDVQTVLDRGPKLDTRPLPLERQVRHLMDVARAYSITGQRDEAITTMLKAERMAPEHVHKHHLPKKIIVSLVQDSTLKPAVELRNLARRINLNFDRAM